jgi:hypothetical protein
MCGVQGSEREITVTLTHSEAASLDALLRSVRGFAHNLRIANAAESAAEGLRTGVKRQRFVNQEIGQ